MKKVKLRAAWNKSEKDIMIYYPRSADGHLLHDHLNCESYWSDGSIKLSLRAELEARGYDLTTLKFSIERKETLEVERKKRTK